MINGLKSYSEYKESGISWLGKIPEHWEVRKLKYAVSFSGGGTPSKANASFWNGHIPWVSPKDMQRAWITDAADHITDEAVKASATSIVPPGALLMVVRSGILRRTIPVAINAVEVALNQDMKALRPKPGVTSSKYLRALVQGNEASLVAEWTKQGATVESIEHEFMANSRVPLPPLPEQADIVRFLDYADARIRRYIRAKRKLIKLLEEEKQAIIFRALTRGLDPNVRLKPSGVQWLGDVPKHWEVRRGKYYFREIDERSISGNEELMSVSHKTGVTARSEKNITMFMAESYVGHKLCRPGDIVVNTMWAWMAAVGVSQRIGIVSPSYAVYRARKQDEFRSPYLDLLLRTEAYRNEYVLGSRGITTSRLRLYPDDFLRILVVRPPVSEQDDILLWIQNETRELQRGIDTAIREIALLNEYRSRLIADVVTGKLDVREAAEKLPEEIPEPESLDEVEDISQDESAADDSDLEAADAA